MAATQISAHTPTRTSTHATLADPAARETVLAKETKHAEPTDEHRTDRWLNQELNNEPRYTYRVGMMLSVTCFGLLQPRAARATMAALLAAIRANAAHNPTPLGDAQISMLLDQPLWFVMPRRGCRYDPDIIIVDAQDRIVLVIEVKGPNAKRQCTPARSLMATGRWSDDSETARAFREAVMDTRPSEVTSHPTEGCTHCYMTNRGDRAGEHVAAFHQCDAYRYGWDWVPDHTTVHPGAVWLVLVPQRTDATNFFDGADSATDWVTADIEAFHAHLGAIDATVLARMSPWERSRVTDLIDGTKVLYRL